MEQFRNILVGIDLSDDDRMVCGKLSEPNRAALDKAIWLAKRTHAKLTFFTVLLPCLDLEGELFDPAMQPHLTDVIESLRKDARDVMQSLTVEAEAEGIAVDQAMTCGTGWLEILRRVVEHGHDLVIAGSHHRHGLGRFLLGSTGQKLLRKCPCPVWVVSPHESKAVKSILIAHDLSEFGDEVAKLGISLAEMLQAKLHVLHTVEYPFEIAYKASEMPEEYLLDYRSQIYRDVNRDFDDMLHRTGLIRRVHESCRHLKSGEAAYWILDIAEKERIDLVVMGTVGRSGLEGVLMGNVAEEVLPKLNCSVLAVKPQGFVCPIRFAEKIEPALA